MCLIGAATVMSSFAPKPAYAAQDCAGLANLKIENTNLLSAVEVPASGDLPAFCRVLGYVRPAINFEIRLPLQDWNGKFYMAGCGGLCGSIVTDRPGSPINLGLRRNYTVSTSDSGHWGSSPADARWAMNNPVAVMDYAQRSVPETARVTKAIIKAFYSSEQRHSYFVGCSNGGRMAAMEGLRYPKDFDGIISGAPALDIVGTTANLWGWVTRANTGPDGKPALSPAKVKLLEHAVYEACGEKISIKDSVISDPRACHFTPSVLQCRTGDAANCLTAAEVMAAEKLYSGPVNSRGQRLFPSGVPLGSEPFWPLWVTGTDTFASEAVADVYRYLVFQPPPGPTFKVTDYDFDKDPSRLAYSASVLNAATFNPSNGEIELGDMNAFRQAGGKLIIYHGWADSEVPPQFTVDFYEALARKSGGMGAAQDFARLFMVPGMDHCGIQTNGPGIAASGIDPLTALEQWVEEGKAPSELIATKVAPNGNQTLWRRPVCAYPKVARYKGGGDPTDASSFICTEP